MKVTSENWKHYGLVQSRISYRSAKILNQNGLLIFLKKQLSTAQTSALQKELNFSVSPLKVPVAEVVAAVESGISGLNDESKTLIRATVIQNLRKPKRIQSNISSEEREDIKEHCKTRQSMNRIGDDKFPDELNFFCP